MNRLSLATLLLAFLATANVAGQSPRDEAMKIPLKEIWAFEMPGTRDVRELEPDKFGEAAQQLNRAEQSFTSKILQELAPLKPNQNSKPGFAVSGSGSDALSKIHALLVSGEHPSKAFCVGCEVSLFVFAHESSYYFHLDKVEQDGNRITVQYRLVFHLTKELTRHFAIIPVGELPIGEYEVRLVPSRTGEQATRIVKPVARDSASRRVCKSFKFRVVECN